MSSMVSNLRAIRQAGQFQRRINSGITANPNATPGAGRGSINSGSPWGMSSGQRPGSWSMLVPRGEDETPNSATTYTELDAPTVPQGNSPHSGIPWGGQHTPGSRLGKRQPDRTWQDSARTGAFGTGAQTKVKDLDARQEVFQQMKQPGADMGALRKQAGALGVSDKGWAAGLGRLQGREPAAPVAPAAATPPAQVAAAAPTKTPNSAPGVPWRSQAPTTWTNAAAGGKQTPGSLAKPITTRVAPAAAPAPAPMAATANPYKMPVQPIEPTVAQTTPMQPPTMASPPPVRQAAPQPPADINSPDPKKRSAAMRKAKNRNWTDPLPRNRGWAADAVRWMTRAHL